MSRHALRDRSGGRGDEGAAAVEFALLVIPLLLIVFGIISFGFLLTFRQTLSQAATEGARAAAVQIDSSKRQSDAEAAVNDAMSAVDKTCGSGGLTCVVSAPQPCGSAECITVTLTYAYADNPMVPSVPLVDQLMPDSLEYAATVRVS